ncbi:hypothetical protein HPP92_014129 [Vanilla planifolia]|uniref:Prephenate dehydratase domain-containing protein n=1 Tax=Vanilla planifolia TaxID=51239 RepID=A0A835QZK3_VANPL|nr:hypothetical protein HPP92_014129 [Vanilla planifolia]
MRPPIFSPAPQPSELQVEIGKWGRDLGPLPKPLSTSDIQASKEGSDLRVAYLGSPGAFSEFAALKAYPQSETVPCEQIEVVFKAVELWVVDKAVLPIENTVAGSIHHNYDLLLCHRLHIAFSQCENALTKLSVILENTDDTATAAQLISSKSLKDAGAIASVHAAQLYGLNILEKGIQAMFLFLQTSIVLTLEEGPGMLFKALAVFAMRKINLTKIESRPQRNRPLRVVDDLNHGTAKYFDYLFHIDFEASMADPIAQKCSISSTGSHRLLCTVSASRVEDKGVTVAVLTFQLSKQLMNFLMLGSFTIAVEGKLQAQKLFGHRFRRFTSCSSTVCKKRFDFYRWLKTIWFHGEPARLPLLTYTGVDVDDMLNPWAVLNEFEML